jgi:hypothetical protein
MCGRGKGGKGLGRGSDEGGCDQLTVGMTAAEKKKFTEEYYKYASYLFHIVEHCDKKDLIDWLIYARRSRAGDACENYDVLFAKIADFCAPDVTEIDEEVLDAEKIKALTEEIHAVKGKKCKATACTEKYINMFGLASTIGPHFDTLTDFIEVTTAGLPDGDEEHDKQIDNLKSCNFLAEQYIQEYKSLLERAADAAPSRASKRRRIA